MITLSEAIFESVVRRCCGILCLSVCRNLLHNLPPVDVSSVGDSSDSGAALTPVTPLAGVFFLSYTVRVTV